MTERDIVERLRIGVADWDHDPRLYEVAADEIERLRAALNVFYHAWQTDNRPSTDALKVAVSLWRNKKAADPEGPAS